METGASKELVQHSEAVSAPALPVPGTATVMESNVREPAEHNEDMSSLQLEIVSTEAAPDLDITLQKSAKEPAQQNEDTSAPQLEPTHKQAAPEVGKPAKTCPKKPAKGIDSIIVPEPIREKEEAAANSQRSCLDDLKPARGIWDNMKAILEEPTTARRPLEPLPAVNSNMPVEARPERGQHRGTGYRSSFSFIKRKD